MVFKEVGNIVLQFLFIMSIWVVGCSPASVEQYADNVPRLALFDFSTGRFVAGELFRTAAASCCVSLWLILMGRSIRKDNLF